MQGSSVVDYAAVSVILFDCGLEFTPMVDWVNLHHYCMNALPNLAKSQL